MLLTRRLTPPAPPPARCRTRSCSSRSQPGRPARDVLAYQLAVALDRAGVRASVEVLTAGAASPAYHAAALAAARPVRSDGDGEHRPPHPDPRRRRRGAPARSPPRGRGGHRARPGGRPVRWRPDREPPPNAPPRRQPWRPSRRPSRRRLPPHHLPRRPHPWTPRPSPAPAAEPRPAAALASGLDGQASTEPESPAAQTSTTQPPARQPPVDELPRRGALAARAARGRTGRRGHDPRRPAAPRHRRVPAHHAAGPDPVRGAHRPGSGHAPPRGRRRARTGGGRGPSALRRHSAGRHPGRRPSGPLDRPLLDPLLDPTVRDPDPLGTSDPATDPATSRPWTTLVVRVALRRVGDAGGRPRRRPRPAHRPADRDRPDSPTTPGARRRTRTRPRRGPDRHPGAVPRGPRGATVRREGEATGAEPQDEAASGAGEGRRSGDPPAAVRNPPYRSRRTDPGVTDPRHGLGRHRPTAADAAAADRARAVARSEPTPRDPAARRAQPSAATGPGCPQPQMPRPRCPSAEIPSDRAEGRRPGPQAGVPGPAERRRPRAADPAPGRAARGGRKPRVTRRAAGRTGTGARRTRRPSGGGAHLLDDLLQAQPVGGVERRRGTGAVAPRRRARRAAGCNEVRRVRGAFRQPVHARGSEHGELDLGGVHRQPQRESSRCCGHPPAWASPKRQRSGSSWCAQSTPVTGPRAASSRSITCGPMSRSAPCSARHPDAAYGPPRSAPDSHRTEPRVSAPAGPGGSPPSQSRMAASWRSVSTIEECTPAAPYRLDDGTGARDVARRAASRRSGAVPPPPPAPRARPAPAGARRGRRRRRSPRRSSNVGHRAGPVGGSQLGGRPRAGAPRRAARSTRGCAASAGPCTRAPTGRPRRDRSAGDPRDHPAPPGLGSGVPPSPSSRSPRRPCCWSATTPPRRRPHPAAGVPATPGRGHGLRRAG